MINPLLRYVIKCLYIILSPQGCDLLIFGGFLLYIMDTNVCIQSAVTLGMLLMLTFVVKYVNCIHLAIYVRLFSM